MQNGGTSGGRNGLKILAVVIAVVMVIASIGVVVLLLGGHDPEPVEYTGAVVPLSSINGYGSGYQFTGRPSDDAGAPIETFTVSSDAQFNGFTGGSFMILDDGGSRSIESVVSTPTATITGGQVTGMIDETYENVELTMTAVSIVYSGYTFGVGASAQGDYIWIAPHASYPTLFNEVHVQGMFMDQDTLEAMAEDFPGSFLSDLDLQAVIGIAADFEFVYSGVMDHFLVINELSFINTVNIQGDVIDTITPGDIARISEAFSSTGMGWITDVVGNIGEGCALLSESQSTIYDNDLWVLLYPLEMDGRFHGICDLEVSESSFSIMDLKLDLNDDDFAPDAGTVSFTVHVGMIIDIQDADYVDGSVLSLWGMMGDDARTQVQSVELTGYGVVVDLESLSDSLSDALGLYDTSDGISTLSTFKNPAFIFLLDEDFSVFGEDDVSIWNYAAICIVPNYVHDASAFHYLEIAGTAYDLSRYFRSNSPVLRIPLIIADSCHDADVDYQQTSIKGMRADDLEYRSVGGLNGAFVSFESAPMGTSLSRLVSVVCGLPSLATRFLPLDLGFYIAVQKDGDGWHYVPVVYLSSGRGSTYFGSDSFDISGVYLDFSYYSPSLNEAIEEVESEENVSMLLPTGLVLAFDMDRISMELQDAVAYGPASTTSAVFDVRYTIDISLRNDPDVAAELYWTNDEGIVLTTWNYYGTDPTPGDGLFSVDCSYLDGDADYGWLVRVKNLGDHTADQRAPGVWQGAEAHTRVNLLAPEPIYQYYPDAPAPGTSMVLHWLFCDDPFFDHYEVYYGYTPDFIPSLDRKFSNINSAYSTTLTVSGAQPGTQYYFIVRVVDVDGWYSDSNVMYTRTYQDLDSGNTMGTARMVQQNTAWTEDTTWLFDEVDYYIIYLTAGQSLDLSMRGNTLGGGDLYLYDSDGYCRSIAATMGVNEDLHYFVTASGFYYVKVQVEVQGTDWYTLWFNTT